LTAIFLP